MRKTCCYCGKKFNGNGVSLFSPPDKPDEVPEKVLVCYELKPEHIKHSCNKCYKKMLKDSIKGQFQTLLDELSKEIEMARNDLYE